MVRYEFLAKWCDVLLLIKLSADVLTYPFSCIYRPNHVLWQQMNILHRTFFILYLTARTSALCLYCRQVMDTLLTRNIKAAGIRGKVIKRPVALPQINFIQYESGLYFFKLCWVHLMCWKQVYVAEMFFWGQRKFIWYLCAMRTFWCKEVSVCVGAYSKINLRRKNILI